MAEIIASEILKSVFEKLASEAIKTYVRSQGIHSELNNLERTLTKIQSLLNDASQKHITNEAVQQWLNDLQHLAYEVDDVLDGPETEAMHREFAQQSRAITSKVRRLVPTCCTNLSLSQRIHHKLDSITTKFEDLEKVSLGLTIINEKSKRSYQTSLVDTSGIVGRQKEKKELLMKLLGDEPCNQNFSVVPIVGMGGLGKTTLARLLYDDEEVRRHFELKAWVCVSDQFDIFNISKLILQSVKGENKEFTDLNLLQVDLKNQLKEKRFLIVLDDVWTECYEDWETLVSPFHECTPGSKIIMTTRKEQLLKKMGYNNLDHLQTLSHDDAMSLFAQHALGAYNFDSHPILRPHGEDIVKKCDGLPLALRVLGRLLRIKTEEEDAWKELLNSEIWRLGKKDEIIPALRLSYHDLSACLKQLFAYSSIFPKDYMFDKDDLILLWMAEGFLNQSSSNKSMERLGLEYFEDLLSRSLFQHAPNDKSLFMTHDLLNDLAISISGEFFLRLEDKMMKNVRNADFERFRHMSFVREEYVDYSKFKALERAKSLRTFLSVSVEPEDGWEDFYLSSKILVDLLPKLVLLRVLSLSDYKISEVPETIGSLKHLRYLNLSRTLIMHLPQNVCNLYNLQTLILFGCDKLSKLPNFLMLKNLQHLDIRDTPLLNKMPLGIELKTMQTLSKIIVGGDDGLALTELKDLANIHGKTRIQGLDKVEVAMHAREANFLQKRFSELYLEWSDVFDESRKESLETEVLSVLKPHNYSLIKLGIASFGGLEFPNWVGDPSFLHLISVSIRGCKKCASLPPLGQLPSLKKLFIEDMDEVKVMGSELIGTSLAFTSLEILELRNMKRLEVWLTDVGVVSFPCLKTLVIRNCPNLVQVTLEALPSLTVLEIFKCDSGVLRRLVQVAPGVTWMEIESISGLNNMVWRGVIECLGSVEVLTIKNCNEIRYLWESMLSKALIKLWSLEVLECQSLVRLGEKDKEGDNGGGNLLKALRRLKIEKRESVEHCRCSNNIEIFCINGCDKLLEKEQILGGDNARVIVNNTSTPMLESLQLFNWPNLTTTIVNLSQLIHLTYLGIEGCPNMESFPDHVLPNLTSLTNLVIHNCPSTDASFPRGFWPPKLQTLYIGQLKKPVLEWGPQSFPTSLVSLLLDDERSEENYVSSSNQLSDLLPSSLIMLGLLGFKKLKSLSAGLQHLTSLQHLILWRCPKMKYLPEILLPSLLMLNINECPNLEGRCSRKGSYWSGISHIPCININTGRGREGGIVNGVILEGSSGDEDRLEGGGGDGNGSHGRGSNKNESEWSLVVDDLEALQRRSTTRAIKRRLLRRRHHYRSRNLRQTLKQDGGGGCDVVL
ncbi:putative disease resistance RPP13-like protein 1 [Bidens hawaiensis]|uniref:putative disease resistance RPP13-like protein 1 n=1 Tax=Bidens hawaiensis TaxID=980011 RepID=UPI00404ABEDE